MHPCPWHASSIHCINSVALRLSFPSEVWRDHQARTPRVLTPSSTALRARACRPDSLLIFCLAGLSFGWGVWSSSNILRCHRNVGASLPQACIDYTCIKIVALKLFSRLMFGGTISLEPQGSFLHQTQTNARACPQAAWSQTFALSRLVFGRGA